MRRQTTVTLGIIVCLVMSCAGSLSAQDMRDHWVFGPGNYVRFEAGGPVFGGVVPMINSEGSASIGDSLGLLKAYAFPGAVFNSSFDTMVNGLIPHSCTTASGGSTVTQGAMFLPIASQDSGNSISLFTITGDSSGCERKYLYRRNIDIDADGGLGAIVEAGDLDPILSMPISEQLTAIRHGNGRDWWVIVRNALPPFFNIGNAFQILLVQSDTVIHVGEFRTAVSSKGGELVASPDGSLLALANVSNIGDSTSQGLMLYDFNRCEGVVSNERIVDFNRTTYGAAFSQNSEVLYLGILDGSLDDCAIVQVDVTDTTLPFQVVYNCSEENYTVADLELGPDGKIYFVTPFCFTTTTDSLHRFLHSIEDPNVIGPACSVQSYTLALQDGIYCFLSLPNHPSYYLGAYPNNCGDTTTALAEPNLDVRWKVYPTIAQQAFVIELPTGTDAEAWIIDAVGRVMKRETIGPGKSSIDVSHWPSGMYRVALQQEGRYLGAKTVVRP